METEKICSSGKPCFATKSEIETYIEMRNKRNGGKGFKFYYCKECGCYHLTNKLTYGEHLLKKHASKYDREKERDIKNYYKELFAI